jgi:hypothetical protein
MEMRSSEAGRYDAILHLPRKNIEIGGADMMHMEA